MATLEQIFEDDDLLSELDEVDDSDYELADGDWSFLSPEQLEDFTLSTTETDSLLMSTAVPEIKALCRNARHVLNKPTNDEISLSDLVNYFFEVIIGSIFSAILEGSLPSHDVAGSDLVQFIKALVYTSIYRTTPTKLFKPANGFLYPVAAALDSSAFNRVLKALKTKRSGANGGTWDAPFSVDPLIRNMEQNLTAASCKLAYIRGTTIISLDDDQYRLTSALSQCMGLARINNPKKAFGVVSTNAVSLISSVVLGMRLAGKGESFGDIAQIVLMWMQSAGLPNQVHGRNETIALDRGYLLPQLVEFLCVQGFNLIGTYKRIKSAPFSFGNVPAGGRRKQIQENGAKSIYVARKKFSGRWMYCMAYRGGRGRVAMLFTTDPRASTWICKPKRRNVEIDPAPEHPLVQIAIGTTTVALTASQGQFKAEMLPPKT